MKKIIFTTFCILMTSQQLFAAQQGSALPELFKDTTLEKHACYERVYTQEELKNYPEKKAVALSLELFENDSKFKIFFNAKIKSINNAEDLIIENLVCAYSDADEKDTCTIERKDSGSVRIEMRDNGDTVKLTNETIKDLGHFGEIFRLKKTACSAAN